MPLDRSPPSPGRILCEVSFVGPADARIIDALARVALGARRRGWQLRLVDVPADVRELIDLMGLGDVLLGVSPSPPGTSPPEATQLTD